jgi:hypothetical protein
MVELILHIGDGKCGSTSINASLFDARQALLENKILYLAPARAAGHSYYLTMFDKYFGKDIAEKKVLAEENIKNTNTALRDFEPEYLIICSELFLRFGAQRLWPFLLNSFEADITATHVTAYFRCPASRYLSGTQQRLKHHSTIVTPDRFKRNTVKPLLDWSKITKSGTTTARLFDRKFLTGGSVVSDFSDVLSGITGSPKIFLPETLENTSLTAEQSIVLQNFRADFLSHMEGKFAEESNRLIRFCSRINRCVAPLSTKLTLSDAARNLINHNNIRIVRKMDKRFPGLDMEGRCVGDAMGKVRGSAPWRPDKIESTLETYDRDIVNHLRQLLPRYNTGLRDGLNVKGENALCHIGGNDKFLKLYGEYLTSEGCYGAAAQVKDLTPANVR